MRTLGGADLAGDIRFRTNPDRVEHATAGQIPQVASPLSLDGRRLAPRVAPPLLGQHTTEILTELGVDEQTQAALRAAGTIR